MSEIKVEELIERLKRTAEEIRDMNICGWGNVIDDAIAALSAPVQRWIPVSDYGRAQFEEWAPKNRLNTAKNSGGDYISEYTNVVWCAWCKSQDVLLPLPPPPSAEKKV